MILRARQMMAEVKTAGMTNIADNEDVERLVERLRKTYDRIPGTGTRLINPDGPEAADLIKALTRQATGAGADDYEADYCRFCNREASQSHTEDCPARDDEGEYVTATPPAPLLDEALIVPVEGLEDALFDALYDSAGLMGVATRKAAKACVEAIAALSHSSSEGVVK